MHPFRVSRVLLAAALGMLLGVIVVATVSQGAGHMAHAAGLSVARSHDPVIVPGAELVEFAGVPLDELALLSYQGGTWEPVPFQVDEVTASGNYTSTEDGLLDANDELVFMGCDGGDQAPPDDWVADEEARLHPRYAIAISRVGAPWAETATDTGARGFRLCVSPFFVGVVTYFVLFLIGKAINSGLSTYPAYQDFPISSDSGGGSGVGIEIVEEGKSKFGKVSYRLKLDFLNKQAAIRFLGRYPQASALKGSGSTDRP